MQKGFYSAAMALKQDNTQNNTPHKKPNQHSELHKQSKHITQNELQQKKLS
jgi:hypothetical protein